MKKMKKLSSIALAFMMSLSVVGGLSTSATALGLTDILEAGKGHLKDLGDRWSHEDSYVSGTTVASSGFRSDDVGRDAIHWADGTASLVMDDSGRWYIQLQDDFVTGPAPDLYIYVAERKVYDESSFWAANPVELSKLESGSGAQYYSVAAPGDHLEVIIWCKRFGAFIGATTVWNS